MRWRGPLAASAATAILLTAALAQDGAGETRVPVTGAPVPEVAMAAETSLEALRRITPIPGDPVRVWWTYEPVVDNSEGFPPGPTDRRLLAVVEYASEAEVEALLAGAAEYPEEIDAPAWLPTPLTTRVQDGRLPVAQRRNVEGFWTAVVGTVSGAPALVVVQMTTT